MKNHEVIQYMLGVCFFGQRENGLPLNRKLIRFQTKF